jgi:hypothetical protein
MQKLVSFKQGDRVVIQIIKSNGTYHQRFTFRFEDFRSKKY